MSYRRKRRRSWRRRGRGAWAKAYLRDLLSTKFPVSPGEVRPVLKGYYLLVEEQRG